MTVPVIIDAGPALNFFSIHKERILLSVLSPIAAPETVANEVHDKAKTDRRFEAAPGVWAKLERARRLRILSDDASPELNAAANRICGIPLIERKRLAKDLGETMAVAHAAVLADAGEDVIVLIDDSGGAQLATAQIKRLKRLAQSGRATGSNRLINTRTVLERAAGGQYIPDKATMRGVYEALRRCDDGLVHIDQTRLLSEDLWSPTPPRNT